MNHKPLIGVIHGASRQGRLSEVPAQWIYELAEQHADLQFELIDTGNHPLPLLKTSANPQAEGAAKRWDAVFQRLDGFIVVVAEEDIQDVATDRCEAVTATEVFMHKPVAFIGFGRRSDLAKVASLRAHALKLHMAPVSQEVHLTMSEVMRVWQMGSGFEDYPHLVRAARDLLDEMAWWSHALKPARSRPAAVAGPVRHPPAPFRVALHWMKALARNWIRRVGEASVRAGGRSAGRALSWPR